MQSTDPIKALLCMFMRKTACCSLVGSSGMMKVLMILSYGVFSDVLWKGSMQIGLKVVD